MGRPHPRRTDGPPVPGLVDCGVLPQGAHNAVGSSLPGMVNHQELGLALGPGQDAGSQAELSLATADKQGSSECSPQPGGAAAVSAAPNPHSPCSL